MTRRAREMTESGIYHIMLRGNEKKSILAIDEEKYRQGDGRLCEKFLKKLIKTEVKKQHNPQYIGIL